MHDKSGRILLIQRERQVVVGEKGIKVAQSVDKRPTEPIPSFPEEKIGWGGRIRTFTVLINSEVSYQLDHAPVVGQNTITIKDLLHSAKTR